MEFLGAFRLVFQADVGLVGWAVCFSTPEIPAKRLHDLNQNGGPPTSISDIFSFPPFLFSDIPIHPFRYVDSVCLGTERTLLMATTSFLKSSWGPAIPATARSSRFPLSCILLGRSSRKFPTTNIRLTAYHSKISGGFRLKFYCFFAFFRLDPSYSIPAINSCVFSFELVQTPLRPLL